MFSTFVSLLEQEEDQILFSQIYQSYQRRMYAVALHFLHDPAWAEDAVQDACVKIMEHFSAYKEIPCNEREFWIVCIVKNTALNMLRGRQYQTEEPPLPVTSGEMDDEMNYRDLVANIQTLPSIYRQVLELKAVLEWSNRDVARYLHITESAVGVRFMRGKKMLREKLTEGVAVYE